MLDLDQIILAVVVMSTIGATLIGRGSLDVRIERHDLWNALCKKVIEYRF
jgi:hypothetical protein